MGEHMSASCYSVHGQVADLSLSHYAENFLISREAIRFSSSILLDGVI
jgi:hypothetical protein